MSKSLEEAGENFNLSDYKARIAKGESGGSGGYMAVSRTSTAMGKYQFLRANRNKYAPGVSDQQFLNTPEIQEKAMDLFTLNNLAAIKRKVGGLHNLQYSVEDTLAAVHFLGLGGALNRNGTLNMHRSDANNCNLATYLQRFRRAKA